MSKVLPHSPGRRANNPEHGPPVNDWSPRKSNRAEYIIHYTNIRHGNCDITKYACNVDVRPNPRRMKILMRMKIYHSRLKNRNLRKITIESMTDVKLRFSPKIFQNLQISPQSILKLSK